MPRTPFSGVRSSWLMLARNSDFARLAASAARSRDSAAWRAVISSVQAPESCARADQNCTASMPMVKVEVTAASSRPSASAARPRPKPIDPRISTQGARLAARISGER